MFSMKDGLISFHQHSLQIHSRTKRQIKDLLKLNTTTQHIATPKEGVCGPERIVSISDLAEQHDSAQCHTVRLSHVLSCDARG